MVESQAAQNGAEVTAISWTGGKDCNLALLAAWRDPTLRVTCLVCFRIECNKFHAHPIEFMQAQASALRMPLYFVNIPKDTTDYKTAYIEGMRKLKADHGIAVMATGDMDYVGDMKRNWIEECGEQAGIRAYLPLWMADRAECLDKLANKEGFNVVYSCVKSPWFDGSWVGRRIDATTIEQMKQMADESDISKVHPSGLYKPLDLGGERGEYHTMCLDGPLYNEPVQITLNDKPIELKDQLSMKLDEERWWAISIQQ
jgi:diphthine-ammonia ligase